MADTVRVEAVGPVLVVTLDRPAKRNAVDAATTAALDAAFARLDADPDLRVGVLAATGPVFCAGSDLVDGPGAPTPAGGEYGVIRRARDKPVVAAVDGPAVGGGFELVLACDLVVASRAASFSLPEGIRGRIANAGALFRAADRLPRSVATELLLTGGTLGAERAHELGLVNRLVGPGAVVDAARGLALEICGSAPGSVTAVLAALRDVDAAREQAGWTATERASAAIAGSPDWTEGTAAFRERRTPRWHQTTEPD